MNELEIIKLFSLVDDSSKAGGSTWDKNFDQRLPSQIKKTTVFTAERIKMGVVA